MTCLVSVEVNFLPVEHFLLAEVGVSILKTVIAKLESQFITLSYHCPIKCIN